MYNLLKNAKSLNWETEVLYFTNKLNPNVYTQNFAIAIMKSSLQKLKNLEGS